MAKESYYFSHDYNARNDQKLVRLQMRHQMTGIGIYWCLVEMLYEEGGKIMRTECERIAFELRTDVERIESVLSEFGLFYFDGEYFCSESVDRRLNERAEKSKKARESVEKRWNNTNVLRSNDERNTIKERKGKENKGKEINNGTQQNLQAEAGQENSTPKKNKEIVQSPQPILSRNMEFGKRYAETETQIEHALRTFKTNGLKASKENILHMLRVFVSEIESKADSKNSFTDFSSHFISWCKVNKSLQLPTQTIRQ